MQKRRVNITHAKEATNCRKICHAINQLSSHRRQPAPILQSEGILVVIDCLNRRRAKQSGSAEVRIELAKTTCTDIGHEMLNYNESNENNQVDDKRRINKRA
jgi:hypothetical protein